MAGFNIHVGTKGPASEFFERLNKGIDYTEQGVKKNLPKLKRALKNQSQALKVGAGLGGAGILYKKLRDAEQNKLERDKLKSEKKYYDLLNSEMEKKAFLDNLDPKTKDTLKGVALSGAATGAGMLAAKGSADLYNKAKEKLDGKPKKYWEQFVEKYPEYEGNKDAEDKFKLFYETSPNLAKHPIAVRTFLRQSEVTSGNVVNFDSLRNVSSIEDSFGRRSNARTEADALRGANNLVGNVSNVYDKIMDDRERELDYRRKLYDYKMKKDEFQKRQE